MTLYRYLLVSLVLGAVVSGETKQQARWRIARSHSQFTYIPKDYAANGLELALQNETLCKIPYDDYLNPEVFDHWYDGHVHASNLASCIFDHLPEWAKAEFTTVSIALGLIPPTLVVIGPDTSGIALLSLRRPLLATALAIGSPALRPGADPVEVLKSAPKVTFGFDTKPGLNWRRWPIIAAILAVEYAIAAAAVFNVAYQVSFLTYQAVCWAAIQLFQTPLVPETAAPLLWVLVVVPVTFMCEFAVRCRVKKIYKDSSFKTSPVSWVANWACSELTPWMYVKTYGFHTEDEGPAWLLFTKFVSLASIAHVLMGSIILSSIFFVEFRNAVITVTTLLSGALGCRFVMLFELYWMRRLHAWENSDDSKRQDTF
ncbi:hypothetical protein F5B22DRAFT_653202 [Xylaria bambusicola]|uniref:uncharacterized protein n=1 Tax=Xylaria bambusicola TaxID=326684 RepID=UPI002007CEB7|nr:uncharacterized protein F5B22DRAFT_653202 [Xylaria bambusicola]KAI0528134.1 hypothetical protein F5B22DRAFT_653202 [Xylaria bambusicola]